MFSCGKKRKENIKRLANFSSIGNDLRHNFVPFYRSIHPFNAWH
ncbi:hypothetical protein [Sulfolobus tengchongensis spindle-shaped virus 3]|nr:hypothetical protein [Sulfolobus tengchongensis spindle-shaped virus 3]